MTLALPLAALFLAAVADSVITWARDARRPIPWVPDYDSRHPRP